MFKKLARTLVQKLVKTLFEKTYSKKTYSKNLAEIFIRVCSLSKIQNFFSKIKNFFLSGFAFLWI